MSAEAGKRTEDDDYLDRVVEYPGMHSTRALV